MPKATVKMLTAQHLEKAKPEVLSFRLYGYRYALNYPEIYGDFDKNFSFDLNAGKPKIVVVPENGVSAILTAVTGQRYRMSTRTVPYINWGEDKMNVSITLGSHLKGKTYDCRYTAIIDDEIIKKYEEDEEKEAMDSHETLPPITSNVLETARFQLSEEYYKDHRDDSKPIDEIPHIKAELMMTTKWQNQHHPNSIYNLHVLATGDMDQYRTLVPDETQFSELWGISDLAIKHLVLGASYVMRENRETDELIKSITDNMVDNLKKIYTGHHQFHLSTKSPVFFFAIDAMVDPIVVANVMYKRLDAIGKEPWAANAKIVIGKEPGWNDFKKNVERKGY